MSDQIADVMETDPTDPHAAELPPGFAPETYLRLNPDVAEAGADAADHYAAWGRAELRELLPEGTGLDHPQSRMLSHTERSTWRAVLAEICEETTLDTVLANHPRAAWLNAGFSLPGYLQQCQDVATGVDNPLEAAFHYLEFGLEEGRMGRPAYWDAAYVRDRYGLAFEPGEASVRQVLAAVLAQGVSPLEAALDEAQHWELGGFSGAAMQGLFDHEYYHAMATQAGLAPDGFARPDCIAHFLEHGLAQMLPLHPDRIFDPEFYAGELAPDDLARLLAGHDPDAAAEDGLDAEEQGPVLYGHWLHVGLRAGLSPNLKAWAKRHFNLDVPEELLEQLPVFRLAANMPESARPREVLDQMLLKPSPALSPLDLTSAPAMECIVTLADRLSVSGDQDQAEWLYWHVLSIDRGHSRALRHLSDLLQRKGRLDMVQALRAQVPNTAEAGWNALTLAEAYLQCQRFEEAAEALIGMPRKALADVAIAAKRKALAQQLFQRIWGNLGRHVAAHGIPRTQAQLRAALRACTPHFSSAIRTRPVRRVALVGNEDLYQCKLYRVDQKAEQLRQAGYEVTVFAPNRELDRFVEQIDGFDAAIFFRVPAFPPMIEAITKAASQGLLTFYEIDDVVFDTDHFPPSLESYAGQIDKGQYAAMACGVPLFEHAMSLCEYGIASTATIVGLMEGKVRSGRVFEHHNALGRLHMAAIRQEETAPVPRDPDAPLVIFYGSGTKAHKEDFHDILEPALAEMVHRHPGRVEIRLIGHFGAFTHLDPETDPVTFMEPVWDFEEFCGRVAQADINLSVLSDSLLTDAKSEIKWMEAAMFGIPSVVSATATHREVIEDGETGYLCNTTADFIAALDALIADPDLRARVGGAARDKVLAEYSLDAMGANLREIFEELRPEATPKKRLVIVNVFYPPQAIGGATRVVHDNVRLLRDQYGDRYDIDVICTLEGGRTPLEVTTYADEGVRVWAITAPPIEGGDMGAREPRMAAVFERLIQRLNPDLVHFHCIQRLTASVVDVVRYRQIPYVITLHDGWWVSPNQFIVDDHDQVTLYDYTRRHDPDFPDRARALARPLGGASRLLAVSESFGALHRSAGLTNVSVVENGVSPLAPAPRVPSATGRVRLAHIGGASRHKGVHLVRNALLANPYKNLELLLIDHAMPPGSLRQEVWGTTPVTITGKVAQSDVASLYARIDILLAPSIWPESYGLVTREALLCGAWVIASDRGGIGADIEEGVNGHRVDVATYAGLADCLWQVDGDPARYLAPPATAPALRAVRDQVDELVTLYDELIAEAEAGRR